MLEREAEVRELASQIKSWRDERGRLTERAAKIARDPKIAYLNGRNPGKEIADLNAQINAGNSKCHVVKERIRAILQEILQVFKVNCDAVVMSSHETRFAAARLLSAAAEKVQVLSASKDVNAIGIREFNELIRSIEPLVIEGGDGALPQARQQSLVPPTFIPNFVDLSSMQGNAEAVIRRMAEILST